MKHAVQLFLGLGVCFLALPGLSQTISLRGQVTDESGGIVPGATVTLAGAGGFLRRAVARNDGIYSFVDLPLGTYTIQASAPGLALPRPVKMSPGSGVQTLNLVLNVVAARQEVTVD